MTHDRPITNQHSRQQQGPELASRAHKPGTAFTSRRQDARGVETYEGYPPDQAGAGQAQGYRRLRRHAFRASAGRRPSPGVITLDLDALPRRRRAAGDKLDALGCAWAPSTRRKHRPEKPRIRVITPLQATITGEEYEAHCEAPG